ncbi:hypothetical protein C8R45DRAFT_1096957 [Mycena sanguinolenta]|nr:hypothetical protein C8R45DRAFT_1096957 [Mycena sanguinolenta]
MCSATLRAPSSLTRPANEPTSSSLESRPIPCQACLFRERYNPNDWSRVVTKPASVYVKLQDDAKVDWVPITTAILDRYAQCQVAIDANLGFIPQQTVGPWGLQSANILPHPHPPRPPSTVDTLPSPPSLHRPVDPAPAALVAPVRALVAYAPSAATRYAGADTVYHAQYKPNSDTHRARLVAYALSSMCTRTRTRTRTAIAPAPRLHSTRHLESSLTRLD